MVEPEPKKEWLVWIEPAQRCISVPIEAYRKLINKKIWGQPDEQIQLGSKNRALFLWEIDPFPTPDKIVRR